MSKLTEEEEACLDPCCARELSDRRKAFDLKQQLNSVDISTAKLKQMAIYSGGSGGRIVCCPCQNRDCQIPDYPLLVALRNETGSNMLSSNETDPWNNGMSSNADENKLKQEEEEEEGDDDDDSDVELDNLLNEFDAVESDQLKLINENRYEMIRKQNEMINLAKSYGFGIHRAIPHDDSNATQFISSCPRVICHICNDKSQCCALFDLYLEKKALNYSGTAFLRVFPTPLSSLAKFLKMDINTQYNGGIVILNKGNIITSINNLSQFGNETFLDTNQLDEWLENTGILESLPQPNEWENIKWPNLSSEEREDIEYYACGHPGCKKTFRHEHVASMLPSEYRS